MRVYFATRLVEWDVCNGGFAQAAMNYLGVFEHAAAGFELLGKPAIVVLIREAAGFPPRAKKATSTVPAAKAASKELLSTLPKAVRSTNSTTASMKSAGTIMARSS